MEEKNKLFVGNLNYAVTEDMLSDLFNGVDGVEVVEAKVISDKFSGRSKGFGFVTLKTEEMAQAAIDALNEKEFEGRQIFVNIAKPMEKRERSGDDNRRSYR